MQQLVMEFLDWAWAVGGLAGTRTLTRSTATGPEMAILGRDGAGGTRREGGQVTCSVNENGDEDVEQCATARSCDAMASNVAESQNRDGV